MNCPFGRILADASPLRPQAPVTGPPLLASRTRSMTTMKTSPPLSYQQSVNRKKILHLAIRNDISGVLGATG